MDPLWLIAPAAAAGSGLLLMLFGLGHLVRGRIARSGVHLVSGGIFAAAGFAFGLLGLNIQSYARLTHEGPVAEVSVAALDKTASRYRVTVRRLDGDFPARACEIRGDEFLIGGAVQKWKPWANLLGLDTTYTLDQISNKYFTAARGNGRLITACDLGAPPPGVDSDLPGGWLGLLTDHSYVADRRFGSADYMPLADGALYRILITQSGFNAEAANQTARAAVRARL